MGPIRAMTPVTATRVLLLREGHRQHDYVHLTYRDIERGQLWSVPFRDVPTGAVPVVAGNRVATWVRNHNGRLELHAFDLAHGDFAFRALPTFVPPAADVDVNILAVGGRIIAAASVAETRVYVVDAATGRVVSNHELDASPSAPRLVQVDHGVLVIPSDARPSILDPESGALSPLSPGSAVGTPPQNVSLREGVAYCTTGRGPIAIRVESETRIRIEGAGVVGTTLWVYAEGSVAAIDLPAGSVRASSGPLSFGPMR